MAITTYYYDKQIKNYVTQFMAIFSGMQVMIGKSSTSEEALVSVPIHYGDKDRVVAYVISEGTVNKMIRLPIMSAHLNGIAMAPELRRGTGTSRKITYVPQGHVFPDDITVIHQLNPVPYKAEMEMVFYASNSEQRFQMLEQILMLFNPILQIQTSDAEFDYTKLTTVTLTNITFNDIYPSGFDRRIIATTLSFDMPIHIAAPVNIRQDYVKSIKYRLGVVSAGAVTDEEMIQELNSQNLEYQDLFNLDDLDLKL